MAHDGMCVFGFQVRIAFFYIQRVAIVRHWLQLRNGRLVGGCGIIY